MEWAVYFIIALSDGSTFSGTRNAATVEECASMAVERYREFKAAQAGQEPQIFQVMCMPKEAK